MKTAKSISLDLKVFLKSQTNITDENLKKVLDLIEDYAIVYYNQGFELAEGINKD